MIKGLMLLASLIGAVGIWSQTEKNLSITESHYLFTKDSKVNLKSDDFSGSFDGVQGRVSINDSLIVTGFDLVIDVNSLSLNMEGMAKHAKSTDFFDAANYPSITFFGNEVSSSDSVWVVSGTMRSKGKELSKTIPFTYSFGKKGVLSIESTFTIKRSDFGIGEPDAVSDEVFIHTVMFAKKK
ncbi:MAG: YceI family protein [Bacteroidota bacterium]